MYISSLETEVESLKSIIAEMTVQIENLEKELQIQKTPRSETKDVASEEFKCDKCGVTYKKEATLRKHINTKHQLNPSEVDILIQNDSNGKELKKARHEIRELKDMVENLTLGKTKLDCEVKSLRTENDSLASLLTMKKNIDNQGSISKPSLKKKKK